MRTALALALVLSACAPVMPMGDAGSDAAPAADATHPVVGTWEATGAGTGTDSDGGTVSGSYRVRLVFAPDGTVTSDSSASAAGCEFHTESARATWRITRSEELEISARSCAPAQRACPMSFASMDCYLSDAFGLQDGTWLLTATSDTLTIRQRGAAMSRVFTRVQ